MKGLVFGLSFGLLWFIYLTEPLPHGTWQLPAVLYYPVVDGLTLSVLGISMGMLIATDSKTPVKVRIGPDALDMAAVGLGTFSYLDMIVRTVVDVVFVTAGVYIFETIRTMMAGSGRTIE